MAIREGLAAVRISDFLDGVLGIFGKESQASNGVVMAIDVDGQCTIAGIGKMFETFKATGKIQHYSGYGQEPKTFYQANYAKAACRFMKFDETFWKMPYDVRSRKIDVYGCAFKCILLD